MERIFESFCIPGYETLILIEQRNGSTSKEVCMQLQLNLDDQSYNENE